jgi:hypothetical protein
MELIDVRRVETCSLKVPVNIGGVDKARVTRGYSDVLSAVLNTMLSIGFINFLSNSLNF